MMTTEVELFLNWDKAKDYVITQGFDYAKGKPKVMNKGFENIFAHEYKHKTQPNVICELVDLRNVILKPSENERLPQILNHIQITIKIPSNENN